MRTQTTGNIKVTLFDKVAYDREKNLVVIERLTTTPTWVDVNWGGSINTISIIVTGKQIGRAHV